MNRLHTLETYLLGRPGSERRPACGDTAVDGGTSAPAFGRLPLGGGGVMTSQDGGRCVRPARDGAE